MIGTFQRSDSKNNIVIKVKINLFFSLKTSNIKSTLITRDSQLHDLYYEIHLFSEYSIFQDLRMFVKSLYELDVSTLR